MKTQVKYGKTLIARNTADAIDVLVEVTATEIEGVERPAIDVVAVIDRSGSMAGSPLESVKDAVKQLLRFASANDRIAVVVFDDEVETILDLKHHDDVEAAARAVARVQSGGMTNLSGGWLKALQILTQSGRPDALRRIIVLTDGHANVGLDSVDTFAPHVSTARATGITTSCIGFADGYDEKFLAAVADAGSGNDYWCAGADQASRVFTQEFAGLASVASQNLEVSIAGSTAVRKVKIRHDFPTVAANDRSKRVTMGDVYGGETRRLLVTLKVQPVDILGPLDLGQISLSWVSVVGEAVMHSVDLPLAITVLPTLDGVDDEGASKEANEMAERMTAERRRREGRELADAGHFSEAAVAFSIAANHFAHLGLREEVALLSADVETLRNQEWSPAQSKKQFSRSRGTAKGRRFDYDDKD